jgi:hypothetical protein
MADWNISSYNEWRFVGAIYQQPLYWSSLMSEALTAGLVTESPAGIWHFYLRFDYNIQFISSLPATSLLEESTSSKCIGVVSQQPSN